MTTIRGISSMATRAVLAELATRYAAAGGGTVAIESVGGVDAAKRVAAGEAFDVVMLASDAIDKLIAAGHVVAPRTDLVRSPVALAVKAGAAKPDLSSEPALKAAVTALAAGGGRIGYSTGPSGQHLARLFERWGLADRMATATLQAPPGVPVASLVARGECALGFQQLSELMNVDGVEVVGVLPPGAEFITTFSAAPGKATPNTAALQAWLAYVNGAEAAAVKRRHGMEPAA